MRTCTTEKHLDIHQDKTKVQRTDEVRYLGIQLHREGNNKTHISKLVSHACNASHKLHLFEETSIIQQISKNIALDAIVKYNSIHGID